MKRLNYLFLFCLIILISGCSKVSYASQAKTKQKPLLIEIGQTTPDARHMRKNVAYWEEYLPFDGIVMRIHPDKYAGRYGSIAADALDPNYWSIAWSVFSDRKVDITEYAGAIDDLKNTPFKKFKNNFLLVCCYPKKNFSPDFFDDKYWANVYQNIAVLAKIAKQGGCVGIMFDNEQYPSCNIWNYTHLKEVYPDRPQDFASYRAQVRKRGREFIKAINSEFPDIELGLFFGSSLMHARMAGRYVIADLEGIETDLKGDFTGSVEVLMAPFLDGLIEAAAKDTKIIDMYELSYYYKTEEEFQRADRVVRTECKAYSEIPELYAEKIGLGMGLYPTHPPHATRNFTPAQLAKSVELAMKYTDKYVWIWNESESFWIKQGHRPILSDYAMTDTRFGLPKLLTYPATPKSVMRHRYEAVDSEYIDAIFQRKKNALEKLK